MKFAFLGYGVESDWSTKSPDDLSVMMEDCLAYDFQLLDAGHMSADGLGLQPSRTAQTLRRRDGAVVVTDGPYAETKEQLGGVGMLDARDMAHAVELMSRHPGLQYGAVFEIRPLHAESMEQQAEALAKWGADRPAVKESSARFAILGYIDEQRAAEFPPERFEAMLQSCHAFDDERVRQGQWISGVRLHDAPRARTLRSQAGRVVVTDGPFAETKECLGGLVVLAFRDLAEAQEVLSRHPALEFGVIMEIRPVDEEFDRFWRARRDARAS